MDFIKKAVSSAGGNKEDKPADNNTQQNDDYLDKAFAAGAKKSGYNLDRNTQEKITDGAREAYEKATGKSVSDKVSN
ncbi:hypothetical protein N7516_001641 [Penicillium verrucosum]|uniref:Uncharacterized protein n=1 Tax=Penicillium nordicum TaxID=229535 RepID=A0A0M8NZC3_9EURO|nr:uncharacterized protein N7516_001641 [Penicillium verrucosum]KAJ5941473.1 hypothetical protein N7516_001641 [Penicillium verrucosum]KOS37461.1 hypothetical protein ACN38_g11740 [Penicillium nordicum]